MSFSISRSPIDSDRFGVAVARGWYPSTSHEVDSLLSFCRTEKIDLCIVRLHGSPAAMANQLTAQGFFVADRLVNWVLDVTHQRATASSSQPLVRPASVSETETLSAIARAAFRDYPSHYRNDSRLNRKAAADVFPDWTRRAVTSGEKDSAVLVSEIAGTPVGYVLLRKETPRTVIELVAVHPDSQQKGCLGSLLNASAVWARSEETSELCIATQENNTAVEKACKRLGFSRGETRLTLHGWLDRIPA